MTWVASHTSLGKNPIPLHVSSHVNYRAQGSALRISTSRQFAPRIAPSDVVNRTGFICANIEHARRNSGLNCPSDWCTVGVRSIPNRGLNISVSDEKFSYKQRLTC